MSNELYTSEYDAAVDYFGDDFDLGDWTSIVEKHTNLLAEDIQVNTSFIGYLQSPAANNIPEADRVSMISATESKLNAARYNFDSLSSVITNFSTFGYESGSSLIGSINGIEMIAYSIVSNYSQIEKELDTIVSLISSPLETFESIGELVYQKFENVTELIANIRNIDLLNAFEVLPNEIQRLLLDTSYSLDLFSVPYRITSMISNILNVIPSIRVESNTEAFSSVFSQLRTVISTANRAASIISNTATAISGLKSSIESGKYYGVIQTASAGLRFLERPTAYAAKYPYNSGYVTESGHIVEIDDTPGSERINIKHTTGSGIEIHPDGAIIAKSKNDAQLMIDRNGEIYIKGLCNITVDGNTSIFGKGSIAIDSDTGIYVSAPESLIVTDGPTTVTAKDVNIISSGKTTLSSSVSTVVSSVGPVTVASDEMITLDSPKIQLGTERTKEMNLYSIGTISSKSRSDTSMKSGRVIDIKAPLIALN